MNKTEILLKLEELGSERTKKKYLNYDIPEPVFGVTIKDLKPIVKEIGVNQELATELYMTGNYDAMYLAGMISDPVNMTKEEFNDWIENARSYFVGDYTIAVMLTDCEIAMEIADEWIASDDLIKISAGFYTYTWLLGVKKDDYFDKKVLENVIKYIENNIQKQPDKIKNAMNYLLMTIGISYIPLHNEAIEASKRIGELEITKNSKATTLKPAHESIITETDKGKLGFKRKNARC